jgi:Domian of unknown function (DUF4952)
VKWLATLSLSCFLSIACPGGQADGQVSQVARNEKLEPPVTCGDYLKQFGHARPDVEFVSCKSVIADAPKVPGFEAIYRVRGRDIEQVDNWLATWSEWEHLRFSCCQWDAPRGYYRDEQGSHYEIDMFAEAYIDGHMVNQRKDFAKLPFATLTVTHYLTLP